MATPDNRIAHLDKPVGDKLEVYKARLHEELGRPFEYQFELLSLEPELKAKDYLGKPMTLMVETRAGDPRPFHGHITRFGQAGMLGRYTRYFCTVRPFLWLLTRASNSRIFCGKTVPQIVTEVLKLHGYTDLGNKLEATYEPREYCVQYRETDFDFVSRLMEEEGIYYYFLHEAAKHTTVLADAYSSHKANKDAEKLPFIPPHVNSAPREEHVRSWTWAHEVQTAAMAINDFDFESPRSPLLAQFKRPLEHAHASFEQYDPIAHFVDAHDAKDGKTGDPTAAKRSELFARVRLEELQARFARAEAQSNCRAVHVGSLVTLEDHPDGTQNGEHLVVAAEYSVFSPGYDAAIAKDPKAAEQPTFDLAFTAQPAKIPFRPERSTPRPFIPGPHVAIVVGEGEIWTDKFGRVKVQFPWDRGKDDDGRKDGAGTCWVRVAQLWAGSGWGGLHVPRVGQEVIVEFIEGDPDRPIITGRVYNGANLPPFDMPTGATKSGILTRSSKGGSADNANEIRFEDKKGEEQVFLHAEKNMDTEVENDQTLWVGRDRKKTVDKNQSEHVKVNKSITVGGDHAESIAGSKNLDVGKSHTESIGGSMTITVKQALTETVGLNYAETVGVAMELTVGAALAETVGANRTENVGGNKSETIGGDSSESISGKHEMSVGGDDSKAVTGALTLSVNKTGELSFKGELKIDSQDKATLKAKTIEFIAEESMTLKVGDAQITLKKGGDIELKGGKLSIKGQSDVKIKGSAIALN